MDKVSELERELAALKEQLNLCNVDQFSTEAELAAAQTEIAALKNEYICKCGLRVEPHRCKTGEEF